jgi:hypothetical protein
MRRVVLCVSSWVASGASWDIVIGDAKRIVDYWTTKGRFAFMEDTATCLAVRRLLLWRVLHLIHEMVPSYRPFITISDTPFSNILPTVRFHAKAAYGSFYSLVRSVASGASIKRLSANEYTALVSEVFAARLASVEQGVVGSLDIHCAEAPNSSVAHKMWCSGFVTTIDPIINIFMRKNGLSKSYYQRVFGASVIGLLEALNGYSLDKGSKSKDFCKDPALALLHYVGSAAIQRADVESIRIRGEIYGDAEMAQLTIRRRYSGSFKRWRILLQCYKKAREINALNGVYGAPSPEDIIGAGSSMVASIKRVIDVDKWKDDQDGWRSWLHDRVHGGIRVVPCGSEFGEDPEVIPTKGVMSDIKAWMNTDRIPKTMGVVQSCLLPSQIDSLDSFVQVRYELMKELLNCYKVFTSSSARIVDRLYFYALPLDHFCGYHDIVNDTSGDLARFDCVTDRTRQRLLVEGADEERMARFEYNTQEMRLLLIRDPLVHTRKVIVPRVGKLSDASRGYLSRTKSIDIAKLRIPAHYARKVGKCSIATTAFQEAVRRVLREHEKRLVCVLDKHKIVENPYLEKAIKKYFRLGMLERTIKVSHLFGCANFDTETFGLSIAGCEHLQYVEYVPDLVWTTNLVPMLYCSSEKCIQRYQVLLIL